MISEMDYLKKYPKIQNNFKVAFDIAYYQKKANTS